MLLNKENKLNQTKIKLYASMYGICAQVYLCVSVRMCVCECLYMFIAFGCECVSLCVHVCFLWESEWKNI